MVFRSHTFSNRTSILANGKRHTVIEDYTHQDQDNHDEAKANANRIVHCVNHFDELVAALKKARVYFMAKGGLYAQEREEILSDISSALQNSKP